MSLGTVWSTHLRVTFARFVLTSSTVIPGRTTCSGTFEHITKTEIEMIPNSVTSLTNDPSRAAEAEGDECACEASISLSQFERLRTKQPKDFDKSSTM